MRNLLQIMVLIVMLALLSACGINDETSSSANTSFQTVDTDTDFSGTGTESVSLRWLPPTTRSDGSFLPANELAGFRIYMGKSKDNLAPIVDLINDNNNEHVVENLSQGSYYFAISAYDSEGMESSMSQAILITLS